MSLSFD